MTSDIVGQGTLYADTGDFLDCAALSICMMFDSEDTFVGTLAEFFDEFVLSPTTNVESLGARGPGNQRKHLEYIAGSG